MPPPTLPSLLQDLVSQRRLGPVLAGVRTLAPASCLAELDDIQEDYRRMARFMLDGAADAGRDAMHRHLLCRTYRLLCRLLADDEALRMPLFISARRAWREFADTQRVAECLQGYVQEMAMLALDTPDVRESKGKVLRQEHYERTARLFLATLDPAPWERARGETYAELLASPTVEPADAALLTAAICLAVWHRFDEHRFRALHHIYKDTAEDMVRVRAFTGLVFAINGEGAQLHPCVEQVAAELFADPEACQRIISLQWQLVQAARAPEAGKEITQEILPDIMASRQFRAIQQGKDDDDSTLRDILHPEELEAEEERTSRHAQRIMELQMQGDDIYFAGMQQLRRLPFFAQTANWLRPFDADCPALDMLRQADMDIFAAVRALNGHAPFCDSDRYAVALTFAHVAGRLPASMKKALDEHKNFLGRVEESPRERDTRLRRMYLQDLYRLYRLSPQATGLHGPFGTAGLFLISEPFHALPPKGIPALCRKLYAVQHYEDVALLFATFRADTTSDTHLLRALCQYRMGRWTTALSMFQEVADHPATPPEHADAALKFAAQCAFNDEDFAEAAPRYERLADLHPDKHSYAVKLALCKQHTGETDEALAILHRLAYDHPADTRVERALAWVCLCSDRLDEAIKHYRALATGSEADRNDTLHLGIALYLDNQMADAVRSLAHYCKGMPRRRDTVQIILDGINDAGQKPDDTTELHILADYVDDMV